MKTPDDSCKSLFQNELEIKVMVNRVDAKPVGNNCEGDVLISNLLERYTAWYKLKRKRGIAWICKIHRELLRNGRYKSGEIDNNLKSDNTHKIIVHDMLDTESVTVLKFVQRQVYTE